MTTHESIFTILDYSNEKSTTKIHNGDITAVSIAGFLTQFGALRDAIADIIRGEIATEAWVGDRTVLTSTPPTDEEASREAKWLVRYVGNTSDKVYTLEIATPLKTGNMLPMSDFADLTSTDMAAFVTAFEALARTPDDDTETVTVQSIQFVGRNL